MKSLLTLSQFLLFFTLIIHLNPAEASSFNSIKRSSYGEACNKSTKCDRSAWLSCQNEQCGCVKPDEMVYDPESRKCVSRIGERCRFALDQDGSDDTKFIFEVTGCVANANCNDEGICICNGNYYEDRNGTCQDALDHLDACETDGEIPCSTYQGLHCQNGKCQCDENISIFSSRKVKRHNRLWWQNWQAHAHTKLNPSSAHPQELDSSEEDEFFDDADDTVNIITTTTPKVRVNVPTSSTSTSKQQCIGLATHPCINSKCVSLASCLNNICVCDAEYYPDSKGHCIPRIEPLNSCTADIQCLQKFNQSFACINGVCNCNSTEAIYDTAWMAYHSPNSDFARLHRFEGSPLTRCVGLVDFKCINRLCTPNAFCSYSSKRIDNPSIQVSDEKKHAGTCKCKDGWSKTIYGTCGASYENSCTSNRDCADGLVCRNLRCYCPYDGQIYVREQQACKSRIGGPCGKSLKAFCEPNAECKAVRSKLFRLENSVGHCVCKKGYVDTGYASNNGCKAEYGTACSTGNDFCDPIAGLQCINKKCDCPTFAEYKKDLRKCVGLVGAKCDFLEEYQCTDNAHCTNTRNKQLRGTCICNEGFEETQNFTCQAVVANDNSTSINF